MDLSSVLIEEEMSSPSDEIPAVEYIVRAKGMPFGVEATDLATFFAGCDIKGGKKNGIHFLKGPGGKTKGMAFVEFIEREDMDKAISCHRNYLGDRYVDVSASTREDMELALAQVAVEEAKNDYSTIIKVSGMPYVAMHDEVATFFAGCDIKGGKKKGITFIMNEQGGPKGLCFVEFLTPEDAEQALKKDRDYMGNRFCQVVKSNQEVLEAAIKEMEEHKSNIEEPVLKLKGLPFKVTKFDIRQFFEGCNISEIELMVNDKGNCRGDAFVEFADIEDAQKAMGFSRQKISHRHVDIYKSSKKEWSDIAPTNPKLKPHTKNDIDEPVVRIQGLPYKAEKEDVIEFFTGLETIAIQVVKDDKGDCRGEAFIEFKDITSTMEALTRHKHSIGTRYIEVFPSSRCDWRSKPRPKHVPKPQDSHPLPHYTDLPDQRGMQYPSSAYNTSHSYPSSSDQKYEAGRKRSYDGMQYATSKDYTYYTPQDAMYAVTPRAVQGYGANRVEYSRGEEERYSKKPSTGNASAVEYLINMVGLPFAATKDDVVCFFHPLQCVNIQIIKNDEGKAKGIAVVGFHSEEERQEAMKKHKCTMGSRYINIYIRDRKRDEDKDSKQQGKHTETYNSSSQGRYGHSAGRRAERSTDSETRSYPEYAQYY